MTATGTPTQPHTDPLPVASFPNGAVTSRDANLLCGELEASPVSPPNWAGLARALYYREGPPGWAEHPLRTSGFEIKLNGE